MIDIRPLGADAASARADVREIFFLSAAARTFASLAEEDAFFRRWTEPYFQNWPDQIWVAVADGKIRGYLTGCADSGSARGALRGSIPGYDLFADLFVDYPAHFHVNVHPSFRGEGVGSALIEAFVSRLKRQGAAGVHIVTAPGQRNRAFYRREGFSFEFQREFGDTDLLFMGRSLTSAT